MQEKADCSQWKSYGWMRGCREPARGSQQPAFPCPYSGDGVTDAETVHLRLCGGIFRVKTR